MAKIRLSSYLVSVSGRMGNVVYFNRYGNEYARVHVNPSNPHTGQQRIVRHTFSDAVKSWQGLAGDERAVYNKKARKLPMSGYNLYISQYMKQNLAASVKTSGGIIPDSQHQQGTQRAHPSVIPPFNIKEPFHTAAIHAPFR